MDKFMNIYSKLLKNNNNDSLILIMESIIEKMESGKNAIYRKNIKFSTKEYICAIIEVLSNNISWRKYNGKIDGRVLNNKHNYYVKLGVYEELYKINLEKYLDKNKKETKYLSIDSTYIPNKNGINCTGRNIFYKNKNGIKVTALVDNKGVPLKVDIEKGNHHDAFIAPKIINTMDKNKSNNKYVLADKGYDSEKIRTLLREKNYIPIIPKRKTKRNIKKSLKNKHKKIYKKRIIVENTFSWIKMFAKIDKLYEKTIKSYNGLLLLAISIIIFKKC